MTVTNLTPTSISGLTKVGATLTASPGTWSYDLDILTLDYQWERCDAGGASCVDIANALLSTYVVQQADVGSTLRVRVHGTESAAPPPSGIGVDRATMLATGGTILRQDTVSASDPLTGLWGQLAAASSARCVYHATGGDPGLKADGAAQGNSAYREIIVQDGDSWQGETAERSELGRNTTTPYYTECAPGSVDGTFALSDEGDHLIHFFSQRYHTNFDMATDAWQVIMQNKQNQPYAANGPVDSAPALEIDIFAGLIVVRNFWNEIWTTPAPPKNVWIRYALEAFYSKDPAKGWIRLYVDNDGDGDFLDADEMSPQIFCPTLATLTSKGSSPRNVGDALPSHMRIGIYHKNTYGTAALDIDNVQVIG